MLGFGEFGQNDGKTRTQTAIAKAEQGIHQLLKDGEVINFSSVARASGGSTKFLHQNENLVARSRHISAHQKGTPTRASETPLIRETTIANILRLRLHDQDELYKNRCASSKARSANYSIKTRYSTNS